MAILSRLTTWTSSSKSSTSIANSKATSKPLSTTYKLNQFEMMKNFAMRRLQNELRHIIADPPTHCSCGPVGDDIFQWQGAIMGPSGTPFGGGVFFLSIEFSFNYPFGPPKIKFQTKVYHPNVDKDGTIHIDILGHQWSPGLTVDRLLLSICSFLPDPNAANTLNPICNLYRNDRKRYDQKVREWSRKYAMG